MKARDFTAWAAVVLLTSYSMGLSIRLYIAEKRVSFLEGKMSVFDLYAVDGTEGTRYTR